MKKTILTAIVLAMATTNIYGQRISAEQEIIDCGTIGYDKPFTVKFNLRNKGRDLQIDTVKTSCGCATASYPRGIISRGDTFTVELTYDARQLGHFEKEAAIFSNASDKPYYIKMRGVVAEEAEEQVTDYPFTIGKVLADKNDIEFDDVNRGDMPVQKIHFINKSTESISPVVMHLPSYLKATVSPNKVAPGRKGTITLTLNSTKLRNFGLNQSSVYLGMYPGDKVNADKEISISAVLLPAFSNMSETQLANSPAMKLSSEVLELGSFEDKQNKSGTIIIENVGKSRLDIRSIQMFTMGLKVKLNKTRLAPGETAKLKITAYKKMLKSARSKPRVLMITNDPSKPKVTIRVNVK